MIGADRRWAFNVVRTNQSMISKWRLKTQQVFKLLNKLWLTWESHSNRGRLWMGMGSGMAQQSFWQCQSKVDFKKSFEIVNHFDQRYSYSHSLTQLLLHDMLSFYVHDNSCAYSNLNYIPCCEWVCSSSRHRSQLCESLQYIQVFLHSIIAWVLIFKVLLIAWLRQFYFWVSSIIQPWVSQSTSSCRSRFRFVMPITSL
jgi:hypothetical protein